MNLNRNIIVDGQNTGLDFKSAIILAMNNTIVQTVADLEFVKALKEKILSAKADKAFSFTTEETLFVKQCAVSLKAGVALEIIAEIAPNDFKKA